MSVKQKKQFSLHKIQFESTTIDRFFSDTAACIWRLDHGLKSGRASVTVVLPPQESKANLELSRSSYEKFDMSFFFSFLFVCIRPYLGSNVT